MAEPGVVTAAHSGRTQGRVAGATAAVAGLDALLGLLFLAAWRATRLAPPML